MFSFDGENSSKRLQNVEEATAINSSQFDVLRAAKRGFQTVWSCKRYPIFKIHIDLNQYISYLSIMIFNQIFLFLEKEYKNNFRYILGMWFGVSEQTLRANEGSEQKRVERMNSNC